MTASRTKKAPPAPPALGDAHVEMVKRLAQVLRRYDLTEIALEEGSLRIALKRGAVASAAREPAAEGVAFPMRTGDRPQGTGLDAAGPTVAPAAPAKAEEETGVVYVTSPLVGTFYRAASPAAAPFVEPGAAVRAGETLCIIEAMKLLNEIESDHAGVVLEVLVENGRPVEYGERLFKLRVGA